MVIPSFGVPVSFARCRSATAGLSVVASRRMNVRLAQLLNTSFPCTPSQTVARALIVTVLGLSSNGRYSNRPAPSVGTVASAVPSPSVSICTWRPAAPSTNWAVPVTVGSVVSLSVGDGPVSFLSRSPVTAGGGTAVRV